MPGTQPVYTHEVIPQSVLPFCILLSSLVIEWRIIRCDFRSFIVCLESIKEAKCYFVCKVLGETESAKIVHTLVLLGKTLRHGGVEQMQRLGGANAKDGRSKCKRWAEQMQRVGHTCLRGGGGGSAGDELSAAFHV